jgi:NAD(P)H dehydrogenase (quinone)
LSEPANIAVIYYSSTGTVYELAQSVAAGAEDAGAKVRLLKVAELAPEAAIASNPAWGDHAAATQDIPVDDTARNAAVFQGRRVAWITAALKAGLASTGSPQDSALSR